MKVLIVDDQAAMLRIIRNQLAQIGISDVEEATDGATAMGKLRQNRFDLIISDWQMEPITGLQLLKLVRSDNALKSIPFLMVTAGGKKEDVIAAKEAGVSDCIAKPFGADTLKSRILNAGLSV